MRQFSHVCKWRIPHESMRMWMFGWGLRKICRCVFTLIAVTSSLTMCKTLNMNCYRMNYLVKALEKYYTYANFHLRKIINVLVYHEAFQMIHVLHQLTFNHLKVYIHVLLIAFIQCPVWKFNILSNYLTRFIQLYQQDVPKGIIRHKGNVKSLNGELVLHSVTMRDEGLYECYLDSSIPLKQYNVTVLNRNCE